MQSRTRVLECLGLLQVLHKSDVLDRGAIFTAGSFVLVVSSEELSVQTGNNFWFAD